MCQYYAVNKDASLTESIRDEARRLGFFKMGVAAAGHLPWRQHFDTWLAHGMQGQMSYMERQAEKRRDPALVLENVRSILILAMNYHSLSEVPDAPLAGEISQYARGEDYHRLMKCRLGALMEFTFRRSPDAHGIYYADTGPVMEKVWGAHSALGWMGKHSNLITREQGSWFFVGVILLDLVLEYDVREKDHCGTCSRCIQACPTGAIVAPYVVNAQRCISYLTIELKGPIPRTLRPMIGNRIFGCDECQDVCPWNRFAVPSTEEAFRPRAFTLAPDLPSLATISAEEFDARFKDSAIGRAGRVGFVRNVVVALGNSHSSEAVPALVRALGDKSALIRTHAAWALGEIGTADAKSALEHVRCTEQDSEVLAEIDFALSRPPTSDLRPPTSDPRLPNARFKA